MEWVLDNGPDSLEVDIGYIAQMELRSTGPSVPAIVDSGLDIRDHFIEPHPGEEISWLEEISDEEARRKLEVVFYPFKKVWVFCTIWDLRAFLCW